MFCNKHLTSAELDLSFRVVEPTNQKYTNSATPRLCLGGELAISLSPPAAACQYI